MYKRRGGGEAGSNAGNDQTYMDSIDSMEAIRVLENFTGARSSSIADTVAFFAVLIPFTVPF